MRLIRLIMLLWCLVVGRVLVVLHGEVTPQECMRHTCAILKQEVMIGLTPQSLTISLLSVERCSRSMGVLDFVS